MVHGTVLPGVEGESGVNPAVRLLKEYVPLIDKKIAKYFDEEIKNSFGFNQKQAKLVKGMLVHSREYILRPTKRLRASFVHYGYKLSGKEPDERVWNSAIGVELVHAALLMHDDFMDQDKSRRGGLTTHEYFGGGHYGEAMAVNAGDALLCLGFELIEDKDVFRAIANTAYGQAFDVSLEKFGKWSEDDVLAVHKTKTALYTYENPLFIGAHLAGLSQKALDILHDYAMDGGVAFQLRDDVLGVFGDPGETGKSADSDLRQGKCTLLVLKALDRPEVRKVWGDKEAGEKDIEAAKQAIKESGSLEYSLNLMRKLAGKAAKSVSKLRELQLNSEAIDYLQGIAEYMVKREV